jgi:hypothetical protein
MENCRRRQSSSVSVLLPTGCPKRVTVKQESIPWQSFVFDAVRSCTIRNTSLGPCTTGIPACVLQGLGGGDFFNRSTAREAVVSPYKIDQNWLCSVILGLLAGWSSWHYLASTTNV